MTAGLVLAGLLTATAVVAVALPFLRDPQPQFDLVAEPAAAERRRLALAEERDRALGALHELEADHRTGRVSDEDYRSQVGPLRREAAQTLRALDAAGGEEQPSPP